MKLLTPMCILLLLLATHLKGQSIKQLERKAQKTLNRGAYSMALYYSQAILQLDSEHTKALEWSKEANQELNMFGTSDAPPDNVSATTYAIAFPDKIEKKPPISVSKNILVVSTFNALDSSALNGTYIGLENGDFDKGYFYQNTDKENKAVFEIRDTQFYTITAKKDLFIAGSTTLTYHSKITPDTIFHEIYLKPAWRLPLHLYFDHEEPNADSLSDPMTNLTYEDVWLDYLYRIDDYIDNNIHKDKATAQIEVGRFFNDYLDANYHQLELFCQQLERCLNSGRSVKLILESPYPYGEIKDHTDALVYRRFDSIENYFSFYKNGIFKPWMANGDLKFTKNILGKGKKTGAIVSPYDLDIAKSRKVVVKMMEIEDD